MVLERAENHLANANEASAKKLERIKIMSIFKKLFGHSDEKPKYKAPDVTFLENDASEVTHTIPISVSPSKQKIIIKEGDDVLVFDSIDQVPEEMRETLEHFGEDGSDAHQSYSVIINGKRETYDSIDDLPEEIRRNLQNDGARG